MTPYPEPSFWLLAKGEIQVMNNQVLIVDDEPGIRTTLAQIVRDEGWEPLSAESSEQALALYSEHHPRVVFLDVWLPDRDGLETLQQLLEIDSAVAVIVMSGHGTTSTAASAIKMGALDYLEKPLSLDSVIDRLNQGFSFALQVSADDGLRRSLEQRALKIDAVERFQSPPLFPLVERSDRPQRTLSGSTVLSGIGLHSGQDTAMTMHPLPPDTGIHFVTIPGRSVIPSHVHSVANTNYATTVSGGGEHIKTVEHLLSALHAYGITNLMVRVNGEIPVLDGSAAEFCQAIEKAEVVDQPVGRREIVVDRVYQIEDGERKLRIEPYDGFSVHYHLRYPPPVGDQTCDYQLNGAQDYSAEIASARTFGFMSDLAMMAELGLAVGGRLNNCILVGDEGVLNTELRFDNEFARHKVLDIIGDLYLLGYPVRGKVTAERSGHRMNIALLRALLADSSTTTNEASVSTG